ncbi:MAG: thiamine biosynthesis protein ThiS [Bacteroidetes bacterium GWA2_31_9]|nr:MAG: thiamine biosynthesis protein ThiS [Bacteroidetes bacterium GWA2_31_9]
MLITVNSNKKEIEANSCLADVINNSVITGERGFAVAVNNKVIPKTNWEQYILNENDNILIIKASQGG